MTNFTMQQGKISMIVFVSKIKQVLMLLGKIAEIGYSA